VLRETDSRTPCRPALIFVARRPGVGGCGCGQIALGIGTDRLDGRSGDEGVVRRQGRRLAHLGFYGGASTRAGRGARAECAGEALPDSQTRLPRIRRHRPPRHRTSPRTQVKDADDEGRWGWTKIGGATRSASGRGDSSIWRGPGTTVAAATPGSRPTPSRLANNNRRRAPRSACSTWSSHYAGLRW